VGGAILLFGRKVLKKHLLSVTLKVTIGLFQKSSMLMVVSQIMMRMTRLQRNQMFLHLKGEGRRLPS
jgi:hypothetical protein